ncbi:MAG: hypothetical protein ACRDRU_29635 [Pseudonocardiaceae bacterium]
MAVFHAERAASGLGGWAGRYQRALAALDIRAAAITRRRGRPQQTTPMRPSWCYSTPGLARAQQLAGQATADTDMYLNVWQPRLAYGGGVQVFSSATVATIMRPRR